MMSGIRGKDTKPELIVRSLLHSSGFRFRLHRKDLPGKPDLVLPKHNTVIFVNGCYWHGHEGCHLYRPPKSREEFWSDKIQTNRDRDLRNMEALESSGWNVLVVWECAVSKSKKLPPEELRDKLIAGILSSEQRVDIRSPM